MLMKQEDYQGAKHKASSQIGFTLIELLVTLTIVAVLLAIAIPGFNETLKNNRITSQVNEFTSALYYARSEAITRGKRVTLCKSADGTAVCQMRVQPIGLKDGLFSLTMTTMLLLTQLQKRY